MAETSAASVSTSRLPGTPESAPALAPHTVMTHPRTRPVNRKRKWASNLLLVAGVGLVGAWAWFELHGILYQVWQNGVFERRKQETPPGQAARPPGVRNGEVLGRLAVPRLHLQAVVREGAGEDTLNVALGHIPGTAFPGQGGNVGVAGHRDTLFRPLRNIRKNDLIEFQTLSGDYSYRVVSTQIVSPQDVEVLRAAQSSEITLVTCYPFYYVGSAPNRFIVKARQVGAIDTAAHPQPAVERVAMPVRRPQPELHKPKPPGPARVAFQVAENHSREFAPGISFGLEWADPAHRTVNGWMWLMPDRRTIWLRNQHVDEPIVFYGYTDGRERKLVITRVTANSAAGYLVLPQGVSAAN